MEKIIIVGFSLKMSMFGTLTQHHSLGLTRSKSDLSMMSNKGGIPLNNINTLKVELSGATL